MTLASVSPAVSRGKQKNVMLKYLLLVLLSPACTSGTRKTLYGDRALGKIKKPKNSSKQHIYDNEFSSRVASGKGRALDARLPTESYRPCRTKLDTLCRAISLAALAEVCREEGCVVNKIFWVSNLRQK